MTLLDEKIKVAQTNNSQAYDKISHSFQELDVKLDQNIDNLDMKLDNLDSKIENLKKQHNKPKKGILIKFSSFVGVIVILRSLI